MEPQPHYRVMYYDVDDGSLQDVSDDFDRAGAALNEAREGACEKHYAVVEQVVATPIYKVSEITKTKVERL